MTNIKRSVTLEKIVDEFDIEIVNKVKPDLKRQIGHTAIHRLGLELAGKREFSSHNNIVGWGTKENNYFKSISEEKTKELLSSAINDNVPFVVLSTGVKGEVLKWIIDRGDETKTPIIKTEHHLSHLTSTLGMVIAYELAETEERHGSLVIVNGIGVMIIGKSGVGKSEAVIELIQAGHYFVSDDTVVIKRTGNIFIGAPAKLTEDLLEVRGIGLVNIKSIYGLQVTRARTNIDLVIELVDYKGKESEFDRLGNADEKEKILGGTLPKMKLPIKEGRSTSSLVQVAVNAYIAKSRGENPIELIGERREGDK